MSRLRDYLAEVRVDPTISPALQTLLALLVEAVEPEGCNVCGGSGSVEMHGRIVACTCAPLPEGEAAKLAAAIRKAGW
jgi:hypothetical protein